MKPPTPAEIELQCAKIGLSSIEGQKFFHYYESNGWKVGKNPMVSWVSALSGWKLRNETTKKPDKPSPSQHRNRFISGAADASANAMFVLNKQNAERKAKAAQDAVATEVAGHGGNPPGRANDGGQGTGVL